MDKVCWEKSELSSQLETLKVQYGQNHGEMLMQIRNLEVLSRTKDTCLTLFLEFSNLFGFHLVRNHKT